MSRPTKLHTIMHAHGSLELQLHATQAMPCRTCPACCQNECGTQPNSKTSHAKPHAIAEPHPTPSELQTSQMHCTGSDGWVARRGRAGRRARGSPPRGPACWWRWLRRRLLWLLRGSTMPWGWLPCLLLSHQHQEQHGGGTALHARPPEGRGAHRTELTTHGSMGAHAVGGGLHVRQCALWPWHIVGEGPRVRMDLWLKEVGEAGVVLLWWVVAPADRATASHLSTSDRSRPAARSRGGRRSHINVSGRLGASSRKGTMVVVCSRGRWPGGSWQRGAGPWGLGGAADGEQSITRHGDSRLRKTTWCADIGLVGGGRASAWGGGVAPWPGEGGAMAGGLGSYGIFGEEPGCCGGR